MCVRACVRARVRACVRASVRPPHGFEKEGSGVHNQNVTVK